MIILTVLLYAIGIIVLIFLALFLFVILVPIRYSFSGQYNNLLMINYNVSFSPLLGLRGYWKSAAENAMQMIVAGFTFNINPDKKKAEKEKPEKKKKDSLNLPLSFYLGNYDKVIIKNGLEAIGDILNVLRPGKIELHGKLGFDEPHLNGYLTAFNSIIKDCSGWSWFDLEPVWSGEHYDVNFLVEGRLIIFTILFRAARFILARRTIKFLWRIKNERAYHAA